MLKLYEIVYEFSLVLPETSLCMSEAVLEKLKDQIKDVDAARSKEVSLFWCGMAEVSFIIRVECGLWLGIK